MLIYHIFVNFIIFHPGSIFFVRSDKKTQNSLIFFMQPRKKRQVIRKTREIIQQTDLTTRIKNTGIITEFSGTAQKTKQK